MSWAYSAQCTLGPTLEQISGYSLIASYITGLKAAMCEWWSKLITLCKECVAKDGEHESGGGYGAIRQPAFR